MAIAYPLLFLSLFSAVSSSASFPFSGLSLNFPSKFEERRHSFSSNENPQPYQTSYFTQNLDHFSFNPQSYDTFQQRYLINDKHWGGGSERAPIHVYLGNEANVEWYAQNTGFLFDIAPYFEALIVFIEHRYYGESLPFGGRRNIAYRNATTLGYLTSTQALADYATLIIDLKKNLSAVDSPVVVFGGSYGGMLAAWFRLKYPHVAIGALASSAPILAFNNLTSSYGLGDVISQDFKSESENCYKVIRESWKILEDLAMRPGGLNVLQKSFKLCKKPTNAYSLENWLATAYSNAAMADYPTPSNLRNPLPAYPVKMMCKAMDTAGGDTLAQLYGAANVFYNYSGNATCFDTDGLSGLRDIGSSGGWDWQACTEMVMPMATSKESIFPPFEWNYSETAMYCKQMFQVEPRPHWITTEFGGPNIERVLKEFGSNIIFSNGLRDPWSSAGILKTISPNIIAIVANEGAHHVDLRYSTKKDPAWLRTIRKREIKIIEWWLLQYYRNCNY